MAPERVKVPVPFFVMLALLPARTPEAVMVRLGFTVHMLVEFVPKVRLPEIELLPVAFKIEVAKAKLEEIFNAPVKVTFVLQAFAALFPDHVMFPVPAFATK